MLLVKMNVLDNEAADMPALLSKAKQADVGVVLMKTQPGGGELPKKYKHTHDPFVALSFAAAATR